MAASWARACASMALTESSPKTFARAVWKPMGLGVGVWRGGLKPEGAPMFTQHCSLHPSSRRICGKVVPGITMRLRTSTFVLGQAGAWRMLVLGGRVDPKARPKPDFWPKRGENLLGLWGGEERGFSGRCRMRLMGEIDMVGEEQVSYLVCNLFP